MIHKVEKNVITESVQGTRQCKICLQCISFRVQYISFSVFLEGVQAVLWTDFHGTRPMVCVPTNVPHCFRVTPAID